jgi:hypothetical protein
MAKIELWLYFTYLAKNRWEHLTNNNKGESNISLLNLAALDTCSSKHEPSEHSISSYASDSYQLP